MKVRKWRILLKNYFESVFAQPLFPRLVRAAALIQNARTIDSKIAARPDTGEFLNNIGAPRT
jgi:hypothetical protein